MTNYSDNDLIIDNINKEVASHHEATSIFHKLLNTFINIYNKPENKDLQRELLFVAKYYGLMTPPLTLEGIGKTTSPSITRERVRQIIDHIIGNNLKPTSNNLYGYTLSLFLTKLTNKGFIKYEDLILYKEFSDYSQNIKGLIAFLNDCGIRQIAYRKKYYFYAPNDESTITCRKNTIAKIQKANKTQRKSETLLKMSHKSKTVTYVPENIRAMLLEESKYRKIKLNLLYEEIIVRFIKCKPYSEQNYKFEKTQSWKARNGTANWQQVGVYIHRDIFNQIKQNINGTNKLFDKNISIMSFICQAFIWHYSHS